MKSTIQSLFATGLMLALPACSNSPEQPAAEQKIAKDITAQRTIKPGASVQITSDYDGKTSPFETETFTLTFTERYAAGTMKVKLTTTGELDLWTADEASFSMSGHDPHTLEVSLSSSVEGRHYLTANIMVETPDGMVFPATRGIAINVGAGASQQAKQAQTESEIRPSGNQVIEMEAEETISPEG